VICFTPQTLSQACFFREITHRRNTPVPLRSYLDRGIAEYAHELTRTHGLHNADAIHVATAVKNKVSVLYTYDAVKQRRKGLLKHNLKVGDPPIRIEKPPDPLKGTLFDQTHVAAISAHGQKDKPEDQQGGQGDKTAPKNGKEKAN